MTVDTSLMTDLEFLSSKRIFFGHQSVGGNILAGLATLQSGITPPPIRIGDLGSLDAPEGQGMLLHTAVGRNEDPASKCDDFRLIIGQKLSGKIDAALLKFCYIDFNDRTDVEEVFGTYARTMDELKAQHPEIRFIHVTAPLRSVDKGPTIWARELVGRPNRSKLANISRTEFSRQLKARYAEDPVFDLAEVMSTYPDGRLESFKLDGETYPSLVPAYTNDGGHLNEVGRSYAAAAFVRSIATALRS